MKSPGSRREGSVGRLLDDAEAKRWALEIGPSKEAKKKPKAKSAQPSLSPMSEPPQNVEVIRKPRKERTVVEDDTEQA